MHLPLEHQLDKARQLRQHSTLTRRVLRSKLGDRAVQQVFTWKNAKRLFSSSKVQEKVVLTPRSRTKSVYVDECAWKTRQQKAAGDRLGQDCCGTELAIRCTALNQLQQNLGLLQMTWFCVFVFLKKSRLSCYTYHI